MVFGGKSRDRRECNGTLEAFCSHPEVDYAAADCSRPADKRVTAAEAFHWRRHLLLAKRPDYLVVFDEIASTLPAQWYLHTTAERLVWDKHRVTSNTAYNASLDIHVLLPPRELTPDEKEGVFGEPAKKSAGREESIRDGQYPFYRLKYVSIPAEPSQSFLTVLHPRKPDGSPLGARLISSSGNRVVLQITLDGQTDQIMLSAQGATFQRGNSPAINLPMQINEPTTIGN